MALDIATIGAEDIARVVTRHLQAADLPGFTMSVLGNEIRQEGDWWYVPVQADDPPRRHTHFMIALADLEEEIDEEEGLNTLLVPCA